MDISRVERRLRVQHVPRDLQHCGAAPRGNSAKCFVETRNETCLVTNRHDFASGGIEKLRLLEVLRIVTRGQRGFWNDDEDVRLVLSRREQPVTGLGDRRAASDDADAEPPAHPRKSVRHRDGVLFVARFDDVDVSSSQARGEYFDVLRHQTEDRLDASLLEQRYENFVSFHSSVCADTYVFVVYGSWEHTTRERDENE